MKMKMEDSVAAVEKIIGYTFRNKNLLEEALTHSSYPESVSYERLEFIGDAVLGHAISNHLFLVYTNVDQRQLSLLRSANVSTEKLARAAVSNCLHRYIRLKTHSLAEHIREFAAAVEQEKGRAIVLYGGAVKAPKVLADVVESVAAAVYVDLDFDLKKLWVVIRGLLEPIVTLNDLEQKPQPVTMLYEICHKNGKKVDIRHSRNGDKSTASVYVDGELFAVASSDQKDIAKLDAAKSAVQKLERVLPITTTTPDNCKGLDGTFEIEEPKQKLYALCGRKKWPTPVYSCGIERDEGTPQNKIFVTSVQVATPDGTLKMLGEEKSRVKDSQNSAASLMIRALLQGQLV
ncbi:putative ribonuclease III [Medicago truncatula]|uniref:Putative ribonuclease III n=1 Tax=Medicago truncatula TaxID=3880 RepID=A0A396IW94_MEDTR|nr:putative ribonuclease III [Medicago truncatula]